MELRSALTAYVVCVLLAAFSIGLAIKMRHYPWPQTGRIAVTINVLTLAGATGLMLLATVGGPRWWAFGILLLCCINVGLPLYFVIALAAAATFVAGRLRWGREYGNGMLALVILAVVHCGIVNWWTMKAIWWLAQFG